MNLFKIKSLHNKNGLAGLALMMWLLMITVSTLITFSYVIITEAKQSKGYIQFQKAKWAAYAGLEDAAMQIKSDSDPWNEKSGTNGNISATQLNSDPGNPNEDLYYYVTIIPTRATAVSGLTGWAPLNTTSGSAKIGFFHLSSTGYIASSGNIDDAKFKKSVQAVVKCISGSSSVSADFVGWTELYGTNTNYKKYIGQ